MKIILICRGLPTPILSFSVSLRTMTPEHKQVEVTYKLDAKRFREVKRTVHIIFGVQD